jgi:predicted house-cleaning noncanonical NTP pyrophosphatase (MazG superfamily)
MELENKIVEWANERGLLEGTTPERQLNKLHEEISEWLEEYENGNREAEMLELGDCFVVLTNIAAKRGYSLKECGWQAYNKIKDRKGKMINGSFVKSEDI